MAKEDTTISFKVTAEMKQALEQQGQRLGLSAGMYVRELAEQAIQQNLTGHHLDEFRELVGQLRQEMSRLADTKTQAPTPASIPTELLKLPDQVAHLTKAVTELATASSHAFASELSELREQLARMMAALHAYRTGDSSKQPALEYARLLLDGNKTNK